MISSNNAAKLPSLAAVASPSTPNPTSSVITYPDSHSLTPRTYLSTCLSKTYDFLQYPNLPPVSPNIAYIHPTVGVEVLKLHRATAAQILTHQLSEKGVDEM